MFYSVVNEMQAHIWQKDDYQMEKCVCVCVCV